MAAVGREREREREREMYVAACKCTLETMNWLGVIWVRCGDVI
eukprot:COSAG06_NODE_68005_length_243_cov_284.027778_1_plen_42_part_01